MKLLLTLILWLSMITLNGQDATEIVHFDQLQKDLGLVKKGEKVKSQFIFTNISSEEVKIDIVSTCECTEANWTSRGIQPGKKGTIDFVFDSAKKEKEEPIDIDVYFVNRNPETQNPYSIYLQYTYKFQQ